ncbi:Rpn family recombination-promoting nuclease/putative transposase [Paenibacillus tepidiphilus]|uniref:Rpn family recombination-promoting nuclease/putative transposase n=1 Tax=Paenibacillus tepidiphilus TaxID=2608683 RepID=UPI00123887B7|nr:Rpn family recombination-promoting nuclease/putative transposase [Paenibacillus tepidiphilus]
MELLDPRIDFVFKRIFASENNKDVLLAFLNDIFADAGEAQLCEVVVLNPFTDKDDPLDKQSVFDIWARAADGKLINIEMQLFNKYDIEKRTLYYWSKRYSGQLQEGGKYKDLNKCVTVNILNYNVLPNEHTHSVFHLREDKYGTPLSDDIEIHFLELPKLGRLQSPVESGLVDWLLFLKGKEIPDWEALSMNNPALQKAMDTLRYLSQDEEARMKYEARMKVLLDEASQMDGALNEGFAKGKQEGKQEGIREGQAKGEKTGRLEVARRLAAMGMDRQTIREATGLDDEELSSLL